MKTYLLVFDDGSNPDIDLLGFLGHLDEGAKIFSLDGHVGFLKSNLPLQHIADEFLKVAGSSLYFIADVSGADYSGRMPGDFWDFFKRQKALSAAE